jgi:hypothetical protein
MTNTLDVEAKIFEMDQKMMNLDVAADPKTLRIERHLLAIDVLMIVQFNRNGYCNIGIYTSPMGSYYMMEKIPTASYNPHFNRIHLLEAVRRSTFESGSQEMLSIIQLT